MNLLSARNESPIPNQLPLGWLAEHSFWLLLAATPLLLFPRGAWPWLGLGLVLVGWAVRALAGHTVAIFTGLEPGLLLLAMLATMGWKIAIDPSLSAPRFWSLILGLLAYVEFARAYRSIRQARAFAILLILATLGVTAIALLGADWTSARLIDPVGFYRHLPSLIHGLPGSGAEAVDLINLRWLGITLGFLIPVPLAVFAWGPEASRLRTLAGLTAGLAFLMLALTQSLQGLFGLAAGGFFLLVWRWRRLAWIGLAGLLAGSLLLLLIYRGVWILPVFRLDNFVGLGVSLRLDIWSRAWAMLKDMPLTGAGLNNFPAQIRNFYPGIVIGNEPHAHQLYLQTALDLGLPGLLAFLYAIGLWFWRLSENYRLTDDRLGRSLYLGLAAGVIAYLAHGFLDALMLGAKPGLLLWIMLGLGAARPAISTEELKPPGQIAQKRRLWIAFGPFFALLLGFASLAVFKPAIVEMNVATLQAHHILLQAPDDEPPDRMTTDVAGTLQRLAVLDPENRTANELAGRLLLRLGNPQLAMQYFYQVVNLDRLDPDKAFYPPAYLSERMRGEQSGYVDKLDKLAEIYQRWIARYPNQASNYLLAAIVYDRFLGYPEEARQVLERGIAHPALPSGALNDYRDQLNSLMHQGPLVGACKSN